MKIIRLMKDHLMLRMMIKPTLRRNTRFSMMQIKANLQHLQISNLTLKRLQTTESKPLRNLSHIKSSLLSNKAMILTINTSKVTLKSNKVRFLLIQT